MRAGSTLIWAALPRTNCTPEHVGDRLRKHVLSLLGHAVADRKQRVAARGEIGSPELKGAARARLPAAAVRGNERGKRPGAGGQIKIAEQRNAIMAGIGDPAAGLDRLRCRHFVSFLTAKNPWFDDSARRDPRPAQRRWHSVRSSPRKRGPCHERVYARLRRAMRGN